MLQLAGTILALLSTPEGEPSVGDMRSADRSRPAPRFEARRPLPSLPSVMIDTFLDGRGLALQTARAKGLQARVLWIDCTANIERYNSAEKVAALVRKVRDSGFNTLVFDVKPISGQVNYPSKIAPRLEEWRGQRLPADFDPLDAVSREADLAGLSFLVSLNAFSEGHRMFRVGPGYDSVERQTVLHEPQPVVVIGGKRFPISPVINAMPSGESLLGGFSDAAKLPERFSGGFAVSVSDSGVIVDGFSYEGSAPRAPTVPARGCVLVGKGRVAEVLASAAQPGKLANFECDPLFVPISERPEQQIPLMMNPNDPVVRNRLLAIVREIATRYPIDGLLFDDRLRFAGLNADFSTLSRELFERHVGSRVDWPDDAYVYTYSPGLVRGIRPGRHFQAWLEWRARTLAEFVAQARLELLSARPEAFLGVYAGSWFGEYSAFGSNYGSPGLEAGVWYLTPEYRKAGFAGLLDVLITGCYYPTATIFDAMASGASVGYTVEYAGYLSNEVARDQAWTYAGIMLSQFKGDPEGLGKALQAACASTQGVMVFDLSHGIEAFWDVFREAFRFAAEPPHAARGLIAQVRKKRAALDATGARRAPVVISPGQPGTGH